uniref:MCC regulator of WNT signaling pathway n=1 Tax=Scleropages formosus TaxID=113540 RepID=A0A8C9W4L2_SCLFO
MAAAGSSAHSGSSDMSSISEEDRMKRLFQSCDGDGDGYISRNDLLMVCQQLRMEDSVTEIMDQIGADKSGKISFEDFKRCHMKLHTEIRKEEGELSLKSDNLDKKALQDNTSCWPASSNNSLGVLSGMTDRWKHDFVAQDLQSPDLQQQQLWPQSSFQKLLEQQGHVQEEQCALHKLLSPPSICCPSLETNYMELGSTCEHSHLMHTHKEVQEQMTMRYEERITELHSIIAELNKKIDLLQGAAIREEDELSELRSELSHSQQEMNEDELSVDHGQNSSSMHEDQTSRIAADMDNCSDLNSELHRVLTGLESVLCGRKERVCSLSVAEVDRHIEQLTTASEHCDLAIKTVEEIEGALGQDFYPSISEEHLRWEKELAGLREENDRLTAMLLSKEEDLKVIKVTLNSTREECEHLRRRVRELQMRFHNVQVDSHCSPSRPSLLSRPMNPSAGEITGNSSDVPVAKVSSNVAEHLAHSLQDCSNIQEIFHTLHAHGSALSENQIREFEVETERLNSRIDHLKSQNDLLAITLEECKSNAERMSMLVGKYESNATALRLALQYSEQCLEAYEMLLTLAETEQSLVYKQFQAAHLGTPGEESHENSVPQILKQAHVCRKMAENAAKDLLSRLDGSCGGTFAMSGCSVQPWESLSSNSHTSTTSSTTSSCDTDFTKEDEQRLKDYIQQLKNDRAAVKLTMLELESIYFDPVSYDVKTRSDCQRLDLENAVLMQELMAMKEEMAELKSQLYLLEKEKKALELKLNTREAQEQAYLVHIEHLKSEVEEHQEQCKWPLTSTDSTTDSGKGGLPAVKLDDLQILNESSLTTDLTNALQREKKIKSRVQELVAALEKLTKSSEIRHQQSAEYVNDLKRANSNLAAAYEKAKKKHQNKLKKVESQMIAMVERHETQVRMLKQRIALLEEENSRPQTNETSL